MPTKLRPINGALFGIISMHSNVWSVKVKVQAIKGNYNTIDDKKIIILNDGISRMFNVDFSFSFLHCLII